MITSASYTRITDFESCPLKAKLKYFDKIPDTRPSPAADRGTAIHLEAENYVSANGPITPHLNNFAAELHTLKDLHRKGDVSLEGEWGFNKDWEPTTWREAWMRIKADVVVTLSPKHTLVVDYKTGRRFGNEVKHAEQLQLYSLAVFVRNPYVQEVTAELWYLDLDELASLYITRNQALTKYLKYYDRRARLLTDCVRFEAKPSQSVCRYCPYKETEFCHESFQLPNKSRKS